MRVCLLGSLLVVASCHIAAAPTIGWSSRRSAVFGWQVEIDRIPRDENVSEGNGLTAFRLGVGQSFAIRHDRCPWTYGVLGVAQVKATDGGFMGSKLVERFAGGGGMAGAALRRGHVSPVAAVFAQTAWLDSSIYPTLSCGENMVSYGVSIAVRWLDGFEVIAAPTVGFGRTGSCPGDT